MFLSTLRHCLIVFMGLSVPAFLVGSGSAMGQDAIESTETIYLYEKTEDSGNVPVITCIDLEREGKLLAVGGDDHLVRLWDFERKMFVMELQEHLDWIRGLAFSPDRARLATIGQDGQLKIWDVRSGQRVQTVKDAVLGAQKVEFHPDGTKFVVCGFDAVVRLYDTETGQLVETLTADGTGNKAVAFSPDGRWMAVAGRTGVIRVWNMVDTRQVLDLRGDGRRVNALAFNSSGTKLASAGDGPFVMLWNPTTGTLIDTLPERPGKTFALAFCGDAILASGESDNVVRLWDLSNRRHVSTLFGHTGTISTMIFETATGRLITGSFDTSIRFWDLPDVVVETAAPATTEPFPAAPALASPTSPFAF